jgi:hypothetical protein
MIFIKNLHQPEANLRVIATTPCYNAKLLIPKTRILSASISLFGEFLLFKNFMDYCVDHYFCCLHKTKNRLKDPIKAKKEQDNKGENTYEYDT